VTGKRVAAPVMACYAGEARRIRMTAPRPGCARHGASGVFFCGHPLGGFNVAGGHPRFNGGFAPTHQPRTQRNGLREGAFFHPVIEGRAGKPRAGFHIRASQNAFGQSGFPFRSDATGMLRFVPERCQMPQLR
jgi:hypothetical protein